MKNIQRGRLAILLTTGISFFVFILYCLIYANCLKTSASYYQIVNENEIVRSPTKYILLYTNFFGSNNWYLPAETVGPDFFRSIQCPETDCIITTHQDLLPSIAYFDALVFHAAERWSQPYPAFRSPFQRYVAAILESPAHTKHPLDRDGNFFNWTMTYRLDSDVLWSYVQLEDTGTGAVAGPAEGALWLKQRQQFRNYSSQRLLGLVRKKSKMAAQFVSHCGAISGRDRLVKAIRKFVQVDVYGDCGEME